MPTCAQARDRFWDLSGAPGRLTIDVDATLITAHSEKERAAGNYEHGYGFHPLGAWADETRETGSPFESDRGLPRDLVTPPIRTRLQSSQEA